MGASKEIPVTQATSSSYITMPSSTTATTITCYLCNASISVKNGTLDKLQYHLETSHEVFYGFEILMAITFLEEHEKEVIVEKVVPRMKLCLETAKNLDKNVGKLDIEKKLFGEKEAAEEHLVKESEYSEPVKHSERGETEKLLEDDVVALEEVEEENPSKRSKMDIFDINESLEISLDESDETLLFPDDETPGEGELGRDQAQCRVCHNVYKKKSINKHTARCELRERVRQMGLAKQAREREGEEHFNVDEATGQTGTVETENVEDSNSVGRSTECGVCGKSLSSRTNLKRHLRNVHRDTSSQVHP